MKTSRLNLVSLGLVLASWLLTVLLYRRLPELVPTHWDARGVANGFTPKPIGPFIMPMITTAVYALFLVLPRISPRGFDLERFRGPLAILQLAITGFMCFATMLALLAGVGIAVPMGRALFAGIGLLLVVIGNFMGKLTKNFFIGIRTPWTLASDEVWLRTHRLGGKLFVVAGLALFVGGLAGAGVALVIAAVALAGLVPAVYSYILYRRLEAGGGGPPATG